MLKEKQKFSGKGNATSEGNEVGASDEQFKYTLRARYDSYNDEHKAAIAEEYCTLFKVNIQAFYYTLNKKQNLSGRELYFFSGIFDCRIQDLFAIPPVETPSVVELIRKRKGYKPGIQARIDIKY